MECSRWLTLARIRAEAASKCGRDEHFTAVANALLPYGDEISSATVPATNREEITS